MIALTKPVLPVILNRGVGSQLSKEWKTLGYASMTLSRGREFLQKLIRLILAVDVKGSIISMASGATPRGSTAGINLPGLPDSPEKISRQVRAKLLVSWRGPGVADPRRDSGGTSGSGQTMMPSSSPGAMAAPGELRKPLWDPNLRLSRGRNRVGASDPPPLPVPFPTLPNHPAPGQGLMVHGPGPDRMGAVQPGITSWRPHPARITLRYLP